MWSGTRREDKNILSNSSLSGAGSSRRGNERLCPIISMKFFPGFALESISTCPSDFLTKLVGLTEGGV